MLISPTPSTPSPHSSNTGYGGNGGHGDDGSNGFDGQNGGNAISLSGKYAAVISETSVEVVRTQEKTNTTRRVLMSPHMQVFFWGNTSKGIF